MSEKIDLNLLSRLLSASIRQDHIEFIAVFGSYAKGNAKKDSDLDLLVRFSDQKSLLDLVRIEREMSEKIGKKIDLVTEKSVSPYMKESIESSLKIIYEK